MYIELQTLKQSVAFAVQVVTDILYASPKPAWKRWIVVFRAIKRLPKLSIDAAAHITDCTRLCKDWAQAPVYHRWNNTARLQHSLTSGSACPTSRSLRREPPQRRVFSGAMIRGLLWVGYCSIVAENGYNGLAEDLRTQGWPSAGWCPAATPSVVTLTPIALSVHCSLHAAGMHSSALLIQITSLRWHWRTKWFN